MKTKHWYLVWGAMFILCAALGFIRDARQEPDWWYTAVSVLFFAPPAVLLWKARREGDARAAAIVGSLSAMSLGITALGLVVNVLSVRWSRAAGEILHGILTVVSTPMIASGYWALSLFLWACLWIAAGKCKRSNG